MRRNGGGGGGGIIASSMLEPRHRPCPERRPGGRRRGQALHHLGERRIGGGRRDLFLPQIEKTARERRGIVAVGHGPGAFGRRRLREDGFGCSIQP
jgi:hypothetical protein